MFVKYPQELQTVRLRESVHNPHLERRVYLNLPQELYKEDIEMIKKTLDSMYVESRPEHTPEHTEPCPACNSR